MSYQDYSSVARLLRKDGSMVGIGCLVPDDHVLTCAHMVTLALELAEDTKPNPDAEVILDFPFVDGGKKRRAHVLSNETVAQNLTLPLEGVDDIAVLKLIDNQQDNAPTANTLGEKDYQGMIDAIKAGELIPFLGAGVNLCDRQEGQRWSPDSQFLPSGEELSRALAMEFAYPSADRNDLLRVSQYVALMHNLQLLYERLRSIFDRDYKPTSLHTFFAKLPRMLQEKKYPSTLLIVTTNYDDVLERAFKAEDQPYDLVTYWIGDQAQQRGKLLHWPRGREPRAINDPSTYDGIKLDERRNLVNPVILKVHGAVDRTVSNAQDPRDCYVITEDDYVEYLTRSDIAALVPVTLREKFTQCGFLFLGYSLRDWNLRVFLNRIKMQQEQNLNFHKSWAIQKQPVKLEQKFWKTRRVGIFDADLCDYIAELDRRVQSLPPGG